MFSYPAVCFCCHMLCALSNFFTSSTVNVCLIRQGFLWAGTGKCDHPPSWASWRLILQPWFCRHGTESNKCRGCSQAPQTTEFGAWERHIGIVPAGMGGRVWQQMATWGALSCGQRSWNSIRVQECGDARKWVWFFAFILVNLTKNPKRKSVTKFGRKKNEIKLEILCISFSVLTLVHRQESKHTGPSTRPQNRS